MRSFLTAIFILFAFTLNASANADGAKQFVQKTADATLAIVSDKSAGDTEKESKLNKLFESSVDIEWTARFALGQHWNDTTDEQKKEYTATYKDYLMSSYVPKFREYTDQDVAIKSVSPDGEGEYLVQTEIINTGKAPIRVDYKIRESKGQYIIFDIIAEGVSMITTQRSDFGSILTRQGVDTLVKKLKEKTALNSKKS